MDAASAWRRLSGSLAPRQDRQGEACRGHRPHPADSRGTGRLPDRNRSGLRHRRGRDGAVVAVGGAWRRRAGVGELRPRLGHRRGEAAQAQGRAHPRCALRPNRRSRAGGLRPRRGVHLERHDVGRARPRRRMDHCPAQGADDLRCDIGRVRHGPAVGQARCDHLFVAKSAGRRGAARDADLEPARGRSTANLHAALAAAQDFSPDPGRQVDRGRVQGRDDQHALDALRRRRARWAQMGGEHRRPRGADWPLRIESGGDRVMGGSHEVDRVSRRGQAHPLLHFGLPEDRRSICHRNEARGAGGVP